MQLHLKLLSRLHEIVVASAAFVIRRPFVDIHPARLSLRGMSLASPTRARLWLLITNFSLLFLAGMSSYSWTSSPTVISSRDGTNIIPKSDEKTSVHDRGRSVGRTPTFGTHRILSIGAHKWVLSGDRGTLLLSPRNVTFDRD